jgi:hypothetical protein
VKSQRITILVLTTYILLTLILTYPLIFNLTGSVPNDIGDPLLNTWILAWDSHAILSHPFQLFDANIFHPLPDTLAYSEHLLSTALLLLPIQVISGEPILAYNLALLLSFPLAALGMYLLALHWTGQRSAAFLAGLIFGFAPYRFATIAHLQLLTFQWLPFIILLVELTQPIPERRSQRRLAPALLIFLLLQILASWYLALYTIIILGLYLLAAIIGHKFKLANLRLLISIFCLAVILALPFAWPYLAFVDDLRQARPLSLALNLAAAPTDFVAAAPFNRLFGPLTAPFRTRPNFTEENTLLPGLIAPLLALISVLALLTRYPKGIGRSVSGSRRSLRSASYPPRFTSHFSLLTSYFFILLILACLLTFPAPYLALANLIPATTIVRVPPRWIIPALFALAALAAFGYAIINEQCDKRTALVVTMNNESDMPTATPTPSPPPITPYALRSVLRFTFYVLRTPSTPKSILLITCAALLLLETLSIPLPLALVENRNTLNPAYFWLANIARSTDFALVELPLHSAPAPEYPEVKRLYASTLGWWQLVNGYSGYTPPRQPLLARALATFPDETALNTLQILATQLPITNAFPGTPQLPMRSLERPNYQLPISLYLLIHPGEAPLDRSQWETTDRWRAERNPALRPLGQFEGDYLYQLLPADPDRFANPPLALFGPDTERKAIHLLTTQLPITNYQLPITNYQSPSLTLFWQTTTPLSTNYTVFIHLRAADGFVRSQADGPPVSNHYPTDAWQPGEIIQDIHPLPLDDFNQVDHLAVGLYNPATGERLPAFDATGRRLTDDALIIPIP